MEGLVGITDSIRSVLGPLALLSAVLAPVALLISTVVRA
jgi:hypothetical protein